MAAARNKAANFERAEIVEELRKLVSESGRGRRTVSSRGKPQALARRTP
jgi:hypothetical protein